LAFESPNNAFVQRGKELLDKFVLKLAFESPNNAFVQRGKELLDKFVLKFKKKQFFIYDSSQT